MTKYAVLISGGNAEVGCDEFWNDLVLMRQALKDNNGFKSENIFVLYGDGNDCQAFPNYCPKSKITTHAAYMTKVKLVFNGLAKGDNNNNIPKLTRSDRLFIWMCGHGDVVPEASHPRSKHSVLKLIEGDMLDTEFKALVNQISCADRIISMQQCFSGGFIPKLKSSKTVVLTACRKDETANGCDDRAPDGSTDIENETSGNVTYDHGEFTYHLLSAITGKTIAGKSVNAATHSSGVVTINDVFNYIVKNDSCDEHPQEGDKGKIGAKLSV